MPEQKASKLKDYREKVKKYYGINFSSDFDIHHIDLNPENNEIENLIILPKKLHSQYHHYLNLTFKKDGEIFERTFNAKICGNEAGMRYDLDMIQGLLEILIECAKWYDYKMYLDGNLPNIHNITL